MDRWMLIPSKQFLSNEMELGIFQHVSVYDADMKSKEASIQECPISLTSHRLFMEGFGSFSVFIFH